MKKTVDARGLSCPQPVILAKQAIEENERIVIIVDNASVVENVRRLGSTMGCEITIDKKDEETFHIHLSRGPVTNDSPGKTPDKPAEEKQSTLHGSSCVVAIPSDTMGKGNDELGAILIKSFIHTLLQLEQLPGTIIFYNAGVKLTAEGSDVIEDLKQMEELGVTILVCGTCTNFFDITDQVAAGTISNMFEIAGTMSQAERLVTP